MLWAGAAPVVDDALAVSGAVVSGLVRGADRRARLVLVVLTQVVGLIGVQAGETPDASPVAMRAGGSMRVARMCVGGPCRRLRRILGTPARSLSCGEK